MTFIFESIYKITLNSFKQKKLIFHLVAIASTYLIVISGFDWFYFTHTQANLVQKILFPAIVLGGLVPIFLPPALYLWGKIKKKNLTKTVSLALFQAVVIGSFISSLYKAFTGRVQPNLLNTTVDISQNFQFGFLEHGIFWGWPSSHTTIAFAMAITLIFLFPKNKIILYCSILYAIYIGIGISVNIHWFSDFLAGGLIGSAIGISVGTFFSKK